MNNDLILNNIRQQRIAQKIKQKDMAKRLNIDPRTYSKIENGKRQNLDVTLLKQIAEALETPLSLLLNTNNKNNGFNHSFIEQKESNSKQEFDFKKEMDSLIQQIQSLHVKLDVLIHYIKK